MPQNKKILKSPFIKIEQTINGLFEKEFGLFTRNGTTALWLALEALACKNRKIVVPANICFVVVSAIILSGNRPFFVDIDKNFSIDPDQLKQIKADEIAGVIFPHLYGNTGSIESVMEIANKQGWFVIEDVAQSFGARTGKKYAGSFADISMTSFGMGKIIDVEIGGVLSCRSKKLYEKVCEIYQFLPSLDEEKLLAYERFNKIYCLLIECLERGDELNQVGVPHIHSYKDAIVNRLGENIDFLDALEIQLNHLETRLKIRGNNAKAFQKLLNHANIQTLSHNPGSTYWRQTMLVEKDRDGLLNYLKKNGVKASKYFPSIDRLFYPRNGKIYQNSDRMAAQIINLWPGEETSLNDISKINTVIQKFYEPSKMVDEV